MTQEQITAAFRKNSSAESLFEIRFKTRSPIKGLFIKTADYHELSRKNLWRIVSEKNIEEFKNTRDETLARIFNGVEFTGIDSKKYTGYSLDFFNFSMTFKYLVLKRVNSKSLLS